MAKLWEAVLLIVCGPAIVGCERNPERPQRDPLLPTVAPPAFSITMKRSDCCFEPCPAYSIRVDGDGNVTWEGMQNVAAKGTRHAHIDPSRVDNLIEMLEQFAFPEPRPWTHIHGPSSVTLILTSGDEVSVAYAPPPDFGHPTDEERNRRSWVWRIAKDIDDLTGAREWTQ